MKDVGWGMCAAMPDRKSPFFRAAVAADDGGIVAVAAAAAAAADADGLFRCISAVNAPPPVAGGDGDRLLAGTSSSS